MRLQALAAQKADVEMELQREETKRRQLQETLKTTRRNYQRLFEIVPCYITVQDRALEMIEANDNKSGRELLRALAEEIAYPDADALVDHGARVMQEMLASEILLGIRRSP